MIPEEMTDDEFPGHPANREAEHRGKGREAPAICLSAHLFHHKSGPLCFLLSHLFGFHRFCELLPEGQMRLRGESEHEMRQSNGLDSAAAGPPRLLEEEAMNGSSSWRQCEARTPFHLHICAQTEFTPQNPRLPKVLLYLILAPSGRKPPTGTRRYLLD